ncbi:MAG: hypothetical protein DWP92_11530 [Armatimonadetes bacterium]|nr:MAG: hypothetical protein DWP92_11530 [Armatimonadota bacterium]
MPYGAACADPSGAVWSLAGAGVPCAGCSITLIIDNTTGAALPNQAALIVGFGPATHLATFGTGCTLDVSPPLSVNHLNIVVVPHSVSGSIPSSLPPSQFTLQVLLKIANKIYSTNPLEMQSC